MDTIVKPLTDSDQTQWQQLYKDYAAFYSMPMEQQTLDTVWSWIMDVDTPFYALAARQAGGKLTGFMHFRAMLSPLRGTSVGFLDDLFVLPEYRGSGVVDALFKALDAEAAQRGWPFVRWLTADDNHRAQGVYNKVAQRTQWVTYQMTTGDSSK